MIYLTLKFGKEFPETLGQGNLARGGGWKLKSRVRQLGNLISELHYRAWVLEALPAGWNGAVCYSFGDGVTLPGFESSAN